jgi:hypothetical protein
LKNLKISAKKELLTGIKEEYKKPAELEKPLMLHKLAKLDNNSPNMDIDSALKYLNLKTIYLSSDI